MVAEDDVVVDRGRAAGDRARAASLQRVPPDVEVVGVGQRRGVDVRDEQAAGEDVDVDAVVAVDVVDAAQAVDRVVARAAGEMVAGLAADDRVVARRRRRR